MKRVAFYTLGCKLNFSETSAVGRLFTEQGYQKVDFEDHPHIFVINTCSVTDHADKKCRRIVKEALKISPEAFIIVMGCYAQLKPQEIASIPGVDVVLGAHEKFKLLELITNFDKKEQTDVYVSCIKDIHTFTHAHSIGDRTRTFLKVQDGCNYHCSFCTIPLARGKSRSDTVESIVEQARNIAQQGIKEIVLTGVNIGDYGIINNRRKTDFLSLIEALDQVEGIKRFRISSIEPNLLNDQIIRFVAQSSRFVPHFHIPLQSGNNEILKLMRRRYQRELYADRVALIKQLMPDCCIGVDVIVGFPGETEERFLDTYQFLNELDISYLHVFPYSERDNTPAINLDGVVSSKDRNRRAHMLRILSEKKQRYFYEQNLDRTVEVLFEQTEVNGTMEGFSDNYIRVSTSYNPDLINTLQQVYLKRLNADGLVEIA
ncbi:MAG: tRNA (N(6)-L-threonylcarbamoyladenosine(37)-C(2))-methylthiotransferase MtaB [Candidatus Amoebophilus sp. 36-38]|nr:MAG: tRNA (N(6)-L-threonylcarbamoyladenosine(37)-C(2))-methylthiotransferase MtaB [Candidatus Amoebophilus sp. 36-38]